MNQEDKMSKFTLDWLKSVTQAEFMAEARKIQQGSQELADLNAVLSSEEGKKIASDMLNDPDYVPVSKREPTPEEAEQIAADIATATAQAAEQEAARAAAAVEEATKAAAAAAPKVEERKKIVVDYQATDENGKPIGRPTHIEGWTNEEVVEKLKAAHINAVRYAERVKTNRFKQSAEAVAVIETTQVAKQMKQESEKLAAEAVAEKDPAKMRESVEKSVQAEREARIAEETARQHGKIIADTWMEDHKEDFVPCLASSNIIGEYMKAQNLSLTYENLEKAFEATKTRLPKVEKQPAVEATPVAKVDNPPAATPATPAAAPVLITPPAAEPAVTEPTANPPAVIPTAAAPAPTSTPVAADKSAEAARRPGVNGSVMPGTMSAARPTVQAQPTDTRATLLKEIAKMPAQEYRKKLRDPNYVKKLNAAGIKVVGS